MTSTLPAVKLSTTGSSVMLSEPSIEGVKIRLVMFYSLASLKESAEHPQIFAISAVSPAVLNVAKNHVRARRARYAKNRSPHARA
jgi:hypothetical protein